MQDSQAVALIVGGGAGIGAATAARLARDGYAIAVVDVLRQRVEQVTQSLEAKGTNALAIVGNALDEGQVQVIVDTAVERFGRLDALVNCVGGSQVVSVAEMTLVQWTDMLRFNLTTQFLTARAVLPVMRRQRSGSIVAFSSGQAWGAPGRAHYAAAKAGVVGFVRSLALEVAKDGIRVNAVAPGMTLTERVREMFPPDEIAARGQQIPLGRPGEPEELAEVAAFLASPASRYMTGQVLLVNGGSLMV